ncbi:MAG: glycosyltransferase [Ignavibacteria bacterium]|nr:glycosyltransferase [Ignavibacteria bacterium]
MNKGLNVIFLGGFAYPTGMAGTKRVQLFIDYFQDTKADVQVLTIGNVGDIKIGNPVNGKYKNVRYKNVGAGFHSTLIYYLLFPFTLFYLFFFLLSSKKYSTKNLIYVYNSVAIDNFLVILFAKLIGYKIIIDIVEDYRLSKENNSSLHSLKIKSTVFFEKRITLFCNAVIVLSSYLEKLFNERTAGKIPVINIPVSTVISEDIKDSKKFNSTIRICYSGSFGHKDGLDTLIEAFKLFNKKFPNSELLLSGMGNNPEKIVADASHPKIKYAGYLNDEDYTKFISRADILCMTRVGSGYANAGFPFKLGEFLATGNPVITTNVSDVSVYLENYNDCIIVTPEKINEVAQALEFYVNNPEKAFSIGQNGREKAKKYFNYESNSEKLLNLMEQI